MRRILSRQQKTTIIFGILSIGFPILVAGLLLLVAAARSPAT